MNLKQAAALQEWHPFFPWFPLFLEDTEKWVWLRWVERKGAWSPVEWADWGLYSTTGGWRWEYRAKQDSPL